MAINVHYFSVFSFIFYNFLSFKFVATTLDGCKQTRIHYNSAIVLNKIMSPTIIAASFEFKDEEFSKIQKIKISMAIKTIDNVIK